MEKDVLNLVKYEQGAKSFVQSDVICVGFPSNIMKDAGLDAGDVIGFRLVDDALILNFIGPMKKIARSAPMQRIRRRGSDAGYLSITANRLPGLNNYDIPAATVKVRFVVIEDEEHGATLSMNIAALKKKEQPKRGFFAQKAEKPKKFKSFGSLKA